MPDELSKSARKREAERLQKIGLKLTQLKPDARARLQLPEALRLAIDEYTEINSREGGRRQIQYIGKLMRRIDSEAIEQRLADLDGQTAAARHFFHTVEGWRDRLTADAKSITVFIDEYPHVERRVTPIGWRCKPTQLPPGGPQPMLTGKPSECCINLYAPQLHPTTKSICPRHVSARSSRGASYNNFVDLKGWLTDAYGYRLAILTANPHTAV